MTQKTSWSWSRILQSSKGVIFEGRAKLMGIGDAFKVANVVEEGESGSTDFVVRELDARHNPFMAG